MAAFIVLLIIIAGIAITFVAVRTWWRLITGYYLMRNRARFGDTNRVIIEKDEYTKD